MIPGINDIIGFIQVIQGAMDAFRIMVNTPDEFTFTLLGIQPLWQAMSMIASLLMVSFLIIGVMQIMIGRSTGKVTTMSMQELITKFVVQMIAINSSFFLVHTLVDIENALCTGLLTFTATTVGNLVLQNNGDLGQFFLNFFLKNISPANIVTLAIGVPLPILALIAIVFVVVLLLVFLQAVMRILRLNLFLVLIPLAMLFLLLEQTREYGVFIIRMLVINIFMQFVQVLAFCLAALLLTFTLVGDAFNHPVIKVFMAIGQLIGIYSVPNLLSHFGIESDTSGVIKATILAARISLKLAGIPVP